MMAEEEGYTLKTIIKPIFITLKCTKGAEKGRMYLRLSCI